MAGDAVVRNAVGARQHRGREGGNSGRVRAHIGTLIEPKLIVEGLNDPFSSHGRAQAVHLIARVVGTDEVLASVLDPRNRSAQLPRRPTHQRILGVELTPNSESAADVILVQNNMRWCHSEHGAQGITVVVGHLGGTVEVENARGRVERGHRPAALQRNSRVTPNAGLDLHDAQARGHGCLDIAVRPGEVQGRGVVQVVERTGLLQRREHHRKFIDLDNDQFLGILSDVPVRCHHDGDRLAHISNAVDG
ncbi:unannotated protein [freshwater metagenome]|uniref:Unannotated protein n=1 Tax=freshwater metagenome TaxID=449393 RepID=A0A6J7J0H7_9ZZZZ